MPDDKKKLFRAFEENSFSAQALELCLSNIQLYYHEKDLKPLADYLVKKKEEKKK